MSRSSFSSFRAFLAWSLPIIAALVAIIEPAHAADDLYHKYKQVYVGQARSDIVNVFGPPASENETSVFGIRYAKMRWQTLRSEPAVTIRLVGGRLVASQYCERAIDC